MKFLLKLHKEGFPFIILGLGFTLLFLCLNNILWILFLAFSIFCIYFFRDPDKVTMVSPDAIISPADGKITNISRNASPPSELGEEAGANMTKVSIFLSVFDIHVNRIPIDGKIIKLRYHPGQFINASLDKSSALNERQSILIETKNKDKIALVQIAGLIARRIVCSLSQDQEVKTGARFGIIRFGSRVDIYVPEHIEIAVCEGQRVVGGETIIGLFKDKNFTDAKFEIRE